MTEEVGRLLAVLGAAGVALAVGYLQRRGTSIRRVRRSFAGLRPGVYFFSSDTCQTCSVMRSRLQAAGIEFTEMSAERESGVFEAQRIGRVPSVARVDRDGSGWLASGVVSEARARRWLTDP